MHSCSLRLELTHSVTLTTALDERHAETDSTHVDWVTKTNEPNFYPRKKWVKNETSEWLMTSDPLKASGFA